MNRIVVYHDSCNDGFCAAWVVALSMPDDERRACRFVPARYGDPLPDGLANAEVMVVDFSYPLDLMENLFRRALTAWMIDHHLTSAEVFRKLDERRGTNKGVIHDESKSGAGLAWDYLGAAMPQSYAWVVKYVEDRDLWRHALPNSREVSAAVRCLPASDVLAHLDAWCSFAERGLDAAVVEGRAILKAEARYVERAASRASLGTIQPPATSPQLPAGSGLEAGGWGLVAVPVICETHLTSDVLHALGEGRRYAVGWSQLPGGRYRYSLRSGAEGEDVSKIAESFGGGGHLHSSGFEAECVVHKILGPLVPR